MLPHPDSLQLSGVRCTVPELDSFCNRTRFGTPYPKGTTPVIRSDNGLVFLSKKFRQTCRAFRLKQEFITPNSPQQNGMIERFFRSIKEECVYLHSFASFKDAKYHIDRWIEWYNDRRPHQALNYISPLDFRAHQQARLVA
jgi:putative transposase